MHVPSFIWMNIELQVRYEYNTKYIICIMAICVYFLSIPGPILLKIYIYYKIPIETLLPLFYFLLKQNGQQTKLYFECIINTAGMFKHITQQHCYKLTFKILSSYWGYACFISKEACFVCLSFTPIPSFSPLFRFSIIVRHTQYLSFWTNLSFVDAFLVIFATFKCPQGNF